MKKKLFAVLLAAVIGLSAGVTASFAAGTRYWVSGYVGAITDMRELQTGVYALADLTVAIKDANQNTAALCVTDETGYFEAYVTRSGAYFLDIRGCNTLSRHIPFTVTNQDVAISTPDKMIGMLLGEYDGDGYINIIDYMEWVSKSGLCCFDEGYEASYDINGDGYINNADYDLFIQAMGSASGVYPVWDTYNIYGDFGSMISLTDQSGENFYSGDEAIYYPSLVASLSSGGVVLQTQNCSTAFRFKGLHPGNYTVTVSGENAIERSIPVTVADESVHLSDKFQKIGLILCDYNQSGTVDADDYALFASQFEQPLTDENAMFDLNYDEVIDAQDAAAFTRLFGAIASSYSTVRYAHSISGYVGAMDSPSSGAGILRGLTGLKVALVSNGVQKDAVTTESAGYYKFINVCPGDYTLVISGGTTLKKCINITVTPDGFIASSYLNKTGVVACNFVQDGIIDGKDLTAFNAKYGKTYKDEDYQMVFDLNLDGIIDINDQNLMIPFLNQTADT